MHYNTLVCSYEEPEEYIANYIPYAFDYADWVEDITAEKAIQMMRNQDKPVGCFVTERMVVYPCDFDDYDQFIRFCLKILETRCKSEGCRFALYDSKG